MLTFSDPSSAFLSLETTRELSPGNLTLRYSLHFKTASHLPNTRVHYRLPLRPVKEVTRRLPQHSLN